MPFLKGASSQVVRLFREVMNDPDVVSEQRRQEEVRKMSEICSFKRGFLASNPKSLVA
jgi:hypothetical protein